MPDRIGDHDVAPLFRELRLGQFQPGCVSVTSLSRESHQQRGSPRALLDKGGQYIGILDKTKGEDGLLALLDLRVGQRLGSEVGNRRGHDDRIGVVAQIAGRLQHIVGGQRVDHFDTRRGRDVDITSDEGHQGSPGHRGGRQRHCLLTRRAVADMTDRIEAFAGAPAADDDVPAAQVGVQIMTLGQRRGHDPGDGLRLGQTTRT